MPLVLEGLVTTLNADQSPHLAPMGPIVDSAISQLTLRPFKSSHTFQNLRRTREGIMHVTDDVELLARAAVNQLEVLSDFVPAKTVSGVVLASACRWYEFRVHSLDEQEDRARLECEVVDQGRIRDFFGFNRAKHAVVEAAILATRIGIVPAEEITAEFARLRIVVSKTAGEQEQRAFDFLAGWVEGRMEKGG